MVLKNLFSKICSYIIICNSMNTIAGEKYSLTKSEEINIGAKFDQYWKKNSNVFPVDAEPLTIPVKLTDSLNIELQLQNLPKYNYHYCVPGYYTDKKNVDNYFATGYLKNNTIKIKHELHDKLKYKRELLLKVNLGKISKNKNEEKSCCRRNGGTFLRLVHDENANDAACLNDKSCIITMDWNNICLDNDVCRKVYIPSEKKAVAVNTIVPESQVASSTSTEIFDDSEDNGNYEAMALFDDNPDSSSDTSVKKGDTALKVSVIVSCCIAAIAVAAAILFFIYYRRRPVTIYGDKENLTKVSESEETYYDTAQITYAVLDLDQPKTIAEFNKTIPQEYVKIIGTMQPK